MDVPLVASAINFMIVNGREKPISAPANLDKQPLLVGFQGFEPKNYKNSLILCCFHFTSAFHFRIIELTKQNSEHFVRLLFYIQTPNKTCKQEFSFQFNPQQECLDG